MKQEKAEMFDAGLPSEDEHSNIDSFHKKAQDANCHSFSNSKSKSRRSLQRNSSSGISSSTRSLRSGESGEQSHTRRLSSRDDTGSGSKTSRRKHSSRHRRSDGASSYSLKDRRSGIKGTEESGGKQKQDENASQRSSRHRRSSHSESPGNYSKKGTVPVLLGSGHRRSSHSHSPRDHSKKDRLSIQERSITFRPSALDGSQTMKSSNVIKEEGKEPQANPTPRRSYETSGHSSSSRRRSSYSQSPGVHTTKGRLSLKSSSGRRSSHSLSPGVLSTKYASTRGFNEEDILENLKVLDIDGGSGQASTLSLDASGKINGSQRRSLSSSERSNIAQRPQPRGSKSRREMEDEERKSKLKMAPASEPRARPQPRKSKSRRESKHEKQKSKLKLAPASEPGAQSIQTAIYVSHKSGSNADVLVEAIHVEGGTIEGTEDEERLTRASERPEQASEIAQEHEKSPFLSCNRIAILVVLLFVSGGGMATYFLLRAAREDPEDVTPRLSTAPVHSPTEAPSSILSELPSSMPAKQQLKYDPPSEEDCEAIKSNRPIAGQDQLQDNFFELPLEVSITEDKDLDVRLQELIEGIQNFLVPLLVGCPQVDSGRVLLDTTKSAIRESRDLEEDTEYVIANAVVSGEYEFHNECRVTSPQPCYRVAITLQLFLKGEERFFVLASILSKRLDTSHESLVNKFGLSPDQFITIILLELKNLTPTESPSTSPSAAPSFAPSRLPSSSPSTSTPTVAESGNPTSYQSSPPTVLPSSIPSESPSDAPTAYPTALPSQSPSSMPSVSLSERPSGEITGIPSNEPSTTPTNVASATPTYNAQPTGSNCVVSEQCLSEMCISGICKSDLGGDCSAEAHCVNGICDTYSVCRTPLGPGAPCARESQCRYDFCSPVGTGTLPVCRSGIGQPCGYHSHCENGVCLSDGTCQEPLSLGSACRSPWDCASGICAADGICKSGRGGTCSEDVHCANSSDVCLPTNTCNAPQNPGSTCSRSSQCRYGTCSGSQCMSYLGNPCSSNGQCLQGTCYRNQYCAQPVNLGGSCTSSTDCASVFVCSSGYCKSNLGGSCYYNSHCVQGSCNSQNECAILVPLGGSCTSSVQCEGSYTCVSSVSQCGFSNNRYCSYDTQCVESSSTCHSYYYNTCQTKSGYGGRCYYNSECLSGSCSSSTFWRNRCN